MILENVRGISRGIRDDNFSRVVFKIKKKTYCNAMNTMRFSAN